MPVTLIDPRGERQSETAKPAPRLSSLAGSQIVTYPIGESRARRSY